MALNLLELPLEILGPILNLLSEKDLFSFILTCTPLYNCVKLERGHLSVVFPGKRVHEGYICEFIWLGLVTFIFKNFGGLRSLEISVCKHFVNLSCLEDFTNIKSLRLSNCESLTDVSSLGLLTRLVNLEITDCSKLINVSYLSELTELETLKLDIPVLADVSKTVSSLSGLQLKTLELRRCNLIHDWGRVGQLYSRQGRICNRCNEIQYYGKNFFYGANRYCRATPIDNAELHDLHQN